MPFGVGGNRVLGVVVNDRSLDVVELQRSGGGRGVVSVADRFVFEEAMTAASAGAIGKSLGAWLAERGVKARRVVIGLPARSLISRRVSVPSAAGADALPALVRMQAERVFSQDSRELALDYPEVGAGEGGGDRSVLVVGAMRRVVDASVAMCAAAGLRVAGVTSAAAELAAADAGSGVMSATDTGERWVIRVSEGSAEMAAIGREGLSMVRHVAVGHGEEIADQVDEAGGAVGLVDRLVAGLRRVMVTEGIAASGRPIGISVWDGAGLGESESMRLGHAVAEAAGGGANGVKVGRIDGLVETNGVVVDEGLSAATAVAMGSLSGSGPVINLIHPRLGRTIKKPTASRNRVAAMVAILILLPVAYLGFDHYSESLAVAELEQMNADRRPEVEAAEQRIAQVKAAEGWFRDRTPMMAALARVTESFPERGSVWATQLTIDETMSGVVQGSASTDQEVLALMDAMRSSGVFEEVKVRFITESGRGETVSSFGIEFRYTGEGGS